MQYNTSRIIRFKFVDIEHVIFFLLFLHIAQDFLKFFPRSAFVTFFSCNTALQALRVSSQ